MREGTGMKLQTYHVTAELQANYYLHFACGFDLTRTHEELEGMTCHVVHVV